ncbi:MAG TPA: hypothetical protein VII06_36535 [Chloroflexota bacterium]|jgi:hypothetical protein
MDRRCDPLFRGLVDSVLPGLTGRDFALVERGTFGEFRWVEFTRRQSDLRAAQLHEQNLVLYHLADHQHVGARFSQRNLVGTTPTQRLAAQVWPHAPEAPVTPDGRSLGLLMHDWVTTAVDVAAT